MLDKIDHANARLGYEEHLPAGKTLQHEVMVDLLVTVATFGAVVTLILVVVQSFM